MKKEELFEIIYQKILDTLDAQFRHYKNYLVAGLSHSPPNHPKSWQELLFSMEEGARIHAPIFILYEISKYNNWKSYTDIHSYYFEFLYNYLDKIECNVLELQTKIDNYQQ